jgi:hypothetical protein
MERTTVPDWPPQDNDSINKFIRRDILNSIGRSFSPNPDHDGDGISFDALAHGGENTPLRNDAAAAVVWTLHARHTGDFEDFPPDGREVVIPGVTVLERHPSGRPAVRRFIDWHFVLAQLGSLPGRPLASDDIIRV